MLCSQCSVRSYSQAYSTSSWAINLLQLLLPIPSVAKLNFAPLSSFVFPRLNIVYTTLCFCVGVENLHTRARGHTRTHTKTKTQTNTHTQTHQKKHTHTHTHTHKQTHTHSNTKHARTHTRACVRVCVCVCMYKCKGKLVPLQSRCGPEGG